VAIVGVMVLARRIRAAGLDESATELRREEAA
jgi:hypothetical protein